MNTVNIPDLNKCNWDKMLAFALRQHGISCQDQIGFIIGYERGYLQGCADSDKKGTQ